MTQEEIIRGHLEKYGSITSFEAFERYGITRLSAKFYNLRQDGLNINNEPLNAINRYGKKVSFVKYKLVSKND